MDVGAAGKAEAAGPCDRAPGGRWGSRLLGWGVGDWTAIQQPRADLAPTGAVLSRSQAALTTVPTIPKLALCRALP